MQVTTDQQSFRDALAEVPGFVYRNSLQLTLVSIAWFVASLPLVTVGSATLAAYTAIHGIRSDRNRIDHRQVLSILRQNGPASMLFSGVPVTFAVVAVTYGTTALAQDSLPGAIGALVAAYIAVYVTLVSIPTFVAMARGTGPVGAARYGVDWLADHPTSALATSLLTVVVFAVSVLLTVGVVLLFAGVALTLHVTVVDTVDERAVESTGQANSADADVVA